MDKKPNTFLADRPWLGHTLRIGIGIFAIYFLIRTGALKPALLGKAMSRHPLQYGSAFILYALVLEFIAYFRWLWLLRQAKVSITKLEVFRLHLIGIFFSGFLPGGTGGDFVKGFYLMRGRSSSEGAAAIGTLLVDRFAGTAGLFLLSALSNLWQQDLWKSSPLLAGQAFFVLGVSGAIVVLIGLYLSPIRPKWLEPSAEPGGRVGFLKHLFAVLVAFRGSPRVLLGAIALSMLVHFCLVGVYALCAHSLGVYLPFSLHVYVAPSLTLLNGIPLSPAGLGFGEAGGALLYKAVGVSLGRAEIPALVHSIVLLTSLLFAPAYFLQKGTAGPPQAS